MRTTHTITELDGAHHGAASLTLNDPGQAFVVTGVVVGQSVLTNVDTGFSGVVSAVTETTVQSTVLFKPGDLYIVTLPVPWIVQNSDGPIYDVECKRCGFSFPTDELTDGWCQVCYDDWPWPVGDEG